VFDVLARHNQMVEGLREGVEHINEEMEL